MCVSVVYTSDLSVDRYDTVGRVFVFPSVFVSTLVDN